LPKLDQARIWIVAKIALRQSAQPHKLGIVLSQEFKVRGCLTGGAHRKNRDMLEIPADFNQFQRFLNYAPAAACIPLALINGD
jgi:hypothetical protein